MSKKNNNNANALDDSQLEAAAGGSYEKDATVRSIARNAGYDISDGYTAEETGDFIKNQLALQRSKANADKRAEVARLENQIGEMRDLLDARYRWGRGS